MKAWSIVGLVFAATIFATIPLSPQVTSRGLALNVDQAQAITYGHARRVSRRVDRRDYRQADALCVAGYIRRLCSRFPAARPGWKCACRSGSVPVMPRFVPDAPVQLDLGAGPCSPNGLGPLCVAIVVFWPAGFFGGDGNT